MTVLGRLASLLMSSTPGRKRREQQPHHQAQQHTTTSLPADDVSLHISKRSRSASGGSSARPHFGVAAASSQVVDLTGDASPETPARSTGCAQAQATAAAAAVADTTRVTQGSGGSRKDPQGQHGTPRAAAGTGTGTATATLAPAAGASPLSGDSSMFSRSRGQPAAEANGSAPADELPAWHSMQGAKRLQAEFKYLTKQIAAGIVTQMHDLAPVADNIFKWQFKLKNFDNHCEGGQRLNEDLSMLSAMHGQDHLLMEASFPGDYPHAPFFLRMVTPRCVWYTGHVTAGGSICIEMLTNSGTPNSWQPGMCVESVMNTVIHNMLHVESVVVRTATGPGGISGPLRIDLEGRYSYNVMGPYSEHEAQAAFSRMLSHHKRNGW